MHTCTSMLSVHSKTKVFNTFKIMLHRYKHSDCKGYDCQVLPPQYSTSVVNYANNRLRISTTSCELTLGITAVLCSVPSWTIATQEPLQVYFYKYDRHHFAQGYHVSHKEGPGFFFFFLQAFFFLLSWTKQSSLFCFTHFDHETLPRVQTSWLDNAH